MFQSILESSVLLKDARVQLHVVSHAPLFDVGNGFGVENGSFIVNEISINLFVLVQSVGKIFY